MGIGIGHIQLIDESKTLRQQQLVAQGLPDLIDEMGVIIRGTLPQSQQRRNMRG